MTRKHGINPQLEHLAAEVISLQPDPKNRRLHDDRNVKAVVDSLRDHGQVKPVVVQRRTDAGLEMVVRAGNGTLEAAKRLGWTQIAAVVLDCDDLEAVKYALRDNRSAELAEWELAGVGEDLRFLRDEGVMLDEVGWSAYEAEPLMAAEWEPAEQTGEEFVVPERRVGLMFTKSEYERLKELVGGKKPTAADVIQLVEAAAKGRAA